MKTLDDFLEEIEKVERCDCDHCIGLVENDVIKAAKIIRAMRARIWVDAQIDLDKEIYKILNGEEG